MTTSSELLYDLSTGEILSSWGCQDMFIPLERTWGGIKRDAPRVAHPNPIPPAQTIQLGGFSWKQYTDYLRRRGLQDLCRAYSAHLIFDSISIEEIEERLRNLTDDSWAIETHDMSRVIRDCATFIYDMWENGSWYKKVQKRASDAGKKNLRFPTSMLSALMEGLAVEQQRQMLGCSRSTIYRVRARLRTELANEDNYMTLEQMEEEFQRS